MLWKVALEASEAFIEAEGHLITRPASKVLISGSALAIISSLNISNSTSISFNPVL